MTDITEDNIMTDIDKFQQLFKETGVKHKRTADGIEIDSFEIDGATHDIFIKFHEDGSFHEFEVYNK